MLPGCHLGHRYCQRGFNVDRCFIGISPGGVGQSLYSLHLSEMYKRNHVDFDPNIWYLDEENRKQVETFARSFIMTGPEAPESNKKLHIDLYKKTMSADGIMGRKPWIQRQNVPYYWVDSARAQSDHEVYWCWQQYIQLYVPTCLGVDRFIRKKFLAAYEDHEPDGIFEANPSLNKFLTTSQASIAGLRLQGAFERDHSKADCYQLIEDYCNGGDGHLTEDVMRDACGLPVRQRQLHVEEGLANLLEADADSEVEREDKDAAGENLRQYLMHEMREKDLETMTFYEFKMLTLKTEEHPSRSKSDIWDSMTKRNIVRSALVRGKTSKNQPGAVMPRFTFKETFASICPNPRF